VTIYPGTLDLLKPEILAEVKKYMEGDPTRLCAGWSYFGADKLNRITRTNDFQPVVGSIKVCVNQISKGDGWYWALLCDEPDSRPDEFHVWIENKRKGYLIDFTSEFFKLNFHRSQVMNQMGSDYIWNRMVPIPDILYVRNFTYKKIKSQYDIEYIPSLTKVIDFKTIAIASMT